MQETSNSGSRPPNERREELESAKQHVQQLVQKQIHEALRVSKKNDCTHEFRVHVRQQYQPRQLQQNAAGQGYGFSLHSPHSSHGFGRCLKELPEWQLADAMSMNFFAD